MTYVVISFSIKEANRYPNELKSLSSSQNPIFLEREMGRTPCCDKANVKKGPWSPEEDAKLKDYIQKHGTGGNWISLPQKSGIYPINPSHFLWLHSKSFDRGYWCHN